MFFRRKTVESFKKVNVFIISGGKCGGSTLKRTFTKIRGFKAVHGHSNLYWNNQSPDDPNAISVHDVLQQNKKLHDDIWVIDSYRDPIERKISGFFETLDDYLPGYQKHSVSELVDICNRKWFREFKSFREWYHPLNEIMVLFGMPRIDKFDFDKKYEIRHHENIKFVKLRFNDIADWGDILSTIFGRKMKITKGNVSDKKSYNKLYDNFKTLYKVPRWYLKEAVNYLEFKTFNNEQEQIRYLEKWGEKVTDEYE